MARLSSFLLAVLAFVQFSPIRAVADGPSITTLPADGITPNAAKLHGTLSANGTKPGYGFEWGETPALGQMTGFIQLVVVPAGPVDMSFPVTGLKANTTYYFRAKATADANVALGETLSFTTAPPAAPLVSLNAPFSAFATSVVCTGSVNPNGSDTTVELFIDGVSYGTTLIPEEAGRLPFGDLRMTATGLTIGQTYTAHVVATNAAGSTTSNDVTFTTVNHPPQVGGDFFEIPYGKAAKLDVLANDTDPDGDPLAITSIGTSTVGQASTDGALITYIPPPGFVGRISLSYTGGDNHGATHFSNVAIQVDRPNGVKNTVLLQTGDSVPGAGEAGSGVPAGATWISFGVPALFDGPIGLRGRFTSPAGEGSAIVVPNRASDLSSQSPTDFRLLLSSGAAAPDAMGSPTSDHCIQFFDPVTSDGGHAAFLAQVADAAGSESTALFTTSSSLRIGDFVRLAQTGTPVPGIAGATWSRLILISISSEEVLLVAQIAGPSVSSVNDLGVWAWDHGGFRLILRDGDPIDTADGPRTISGFTMLDTVAGSSGQNRHHRYGIYTALVRTTDGHTGIAHGTLITAMSLVEQTGDTFDLTTGAGVVTGAQWKALKVPANGGTPNNPWNGLDEFVFRGTLRPGTAGALAANAAGIFRRTTNGTVRAVVRAGQRVLDGAGTPLGVVYSAFGDPVLTEDGSTVVFTANVTGPDVSAADDTLLAYSNGQSPVVLLREGDPAPGTSANFGSFLSIASPNRSDPGRAHPVFTTLLTGPGVNQTNDVALWGFDVHETLRLLLREGAVLPTQTGSKIVRNFATLKSVAGSPGVTRSFDSGGVVSRVTFTDNTQAIVLSLLP